MHDQPICPWEVTATGKLGRSAAKPRTMSGNLLGTTRRSLRERARSYAELRLRRNGEKQYQVKVVKEIIEEMNERLVEFAEVCNRRGPRFFEDQAVWNNYHAACCRYRELQADIIRQIKEELDPQARSVREEAEGDVDQLFRPRCSRCKEPISEVATA